VGEEQSEAIDASWQQKKGKGKDEYKPLGFYHVGELNHKSAAYVAGYVQKKNQYNKDMYEELNIVPEYCTMSNGGRTKQGGIGYPFIRKLAKHIEKHPEALTPNGDVPISLDMHGRTMPLGRYLREKLREELGLSHDLITEYDPETGEIHEKKIWHAKEDQKENYKTELRLMQENAQNDPKLPENATVSLKHLLEYQNAGKHAQFKKRQQMQKDTTTL
jgi:hypothetical protein